MHKPTKLPVQFNVGQVANVRIHRDQAVTQVSGKIVSVTSHGVVIRKNITDTTGAEEWFPYASANVTTVPCGN